MGMGSAVCHTCVTWCVEGYTGDASEVSVDRTGAERIAYGRREMQAFRGHAFAWRLERHNGCAECDS